MKPMPWIPKRARASAIIALGGVGVVGLVGGGGGGTIKNGGLRAAA